MATLALHDGEVVGSGRLIQIVWGKPASPALVNTLQSHLSYLRHALGSKTVILARSPGYVFNLGEGDTDVRCVERLLQQGQQATGASEAVQRLGEALALWRGVPLADVTGLAWLEEQAERLDELRLRVQRMLDEQLHAMLMVALYRAGRQADALAAYHRLRHILGEELGIDPGQRLRELQAAILRQDPSLDAPAPTPAALTPAAAVPVMRQAPTPAQLPSAVTGFAGRAAEPASLDALVPRAVDTGVAKAGTGAARSGAVVISVDENCQIQALDRNQPGLPWKKGRCGP